MEVRQRGLIAGFLTAALLVAPLAAEAKRAGGGKSHGMSRQAAPTQSYQQPRQATPVQQPSAPATAPAKSGPGVGGMVAAGVAGAAIGVTHKKFKKWHSTFIDNLSTSIKLHKINKIKQSLRVFCKINKIFI